jgi:pyruvate/2-oxoglutarate dehydrogenase complex dihydrolipoamide acyltransferase (E2) component
VALDIGERPGETLEALGEEPRHQTDAIPAGEVLERWKCGCGRLVRQAAARSRNPLRPRRTCRQPPGKPRASRARRRRALRQGLSAASCRDGGAPGPTRTRPASRRPRSPPRSATFRSGAAARASPRPAGQ